MRRRFGFLAPFVCRRFVLADRSMIANTASQNRHKEGAVSKQHDAEVDRCSGGVYAATVAA